MTLGTVAAELQDLNFLLTISLEKKWSKETYIEIVTCAQRIQPLECDDFGNKATEIVSTIGLLTRVPTISMWWDQLLCSQTKEARNRRLSSTVLGHSMTTTQNVRET